MKHNLKTLLKFYKGYETEEKEYLCALIEELEQLKQTYQNSKQTGKYLIIALIDEILGENKQ